MQEHLEIKTEGPLTEIINRRGEALPLREPVKLSINGLIDSPQKFFIAREKEIDFLNSHVIVDRNNLSITLQLNETDFYGSVITGTLKYNSALAAFGINKNKTYSLKEITSLIRINRMYFENKDEHSKLIEKLYNFNAKVVTNIKDEDNRKGNINKQLQKETDSNVPAGFKLNIPIYEGQPESKFFVDVLADISDVQVKFWFESVDLIELEFDLANQIINKSIESFKDKIVILEV